MANSSVPNSEPAQGAGRQSTSEDDALRTIAGNPPHSALRDVLGNSPASALRVIHLPDPGTAATINAATGDPVPVTRRVVITNPRTRVSHPNADGSVRG